MGVHFFRRSVVLHFFLTLGGVLGTAAEGPSPAWAPKDLPPDLLSGYGEDSGPWGVVYHRGLSPDERKRMALEIAGALARAEARIGRTMGRPFAAVFAPDRKEFETLYRTLAGKRPEEWVAGAAFPALHLLLVRCDSFPVLKRRAERPLGILEHELAHLIVHSWAGDAIPRWFDEGVAMWASRAVLDPEDEAFLSGLARLGVLPPFRALEDEIPASHNLASVAYEESLLAVQWLVLVHGPGLIGAILDRLKEGLKFRDAIRIQTGLPLDRLEVEFRAFVKLKHSTLEILLTSFSLWTFASLLALLAILRGVFRRRRLLRQMEEKETEEEDAETGDPPEEMEGNR